MTTFDTPQPSAHATLLFLGDCNTRGTPDIESLSYPELIARQCQVRSINCGHTMTTCREGSRYYQAFRGRAFDLLCIQYGLVDSWLTFRYSPYVLYYPDNPVRKFARKLVKKYKKVCKKLGLNKTIGVTNVVPIQEYSQRIETMIRDAAPRPVLLIETIPNKDDSRNPEIRRYNSALRELADRYTQVTLLELYADFEGDQQTHYSDPTHLSAEGHAYVANKLACLLEEKQLIKGIQA